LTDKTREVLAETSERWYDLVAEAHAEYAGHREEGNGGSRAEPAIGTTESKEHAAPSEARSEAEEPKGKARPSRQSDEAQPEAA
jgi:hypothetical protein